MPEPYDPFLPQRVDESIEQLTPTSGEQIQRNRDAHLISDLQKLYEPERARYQQALQRVEGRLVEHYSAQERHFADLATVPLRRQLPWRRKAQQGRLKGNFNTMEIRQSSTSHFTKFGARLALVAVILIVLGSMLAVFSYAYQRTTTGGGGNITLPVAKTPTPRPTPKPEVPIGTTLYTTPSNTMGFAGLSWSPDSKRVASASDSVQIWDAATGKHLVKVNTSEWAYGLDWSPDSQEVALATNQHILIVNGQTGEIKRTYAPGAVAVTHTTSSAGTSYLTSQFPAGGGTGYRSTAWSPDGRLMASALSNGPSGDVQIWNPQTGALSYTLSVNDASYLATKLSWSFDGQYIAADTFNTQGGVTGRIVVWSTATHQIVLQHDDMLAGSDAPVIWQPHSHNIAFVGSVSSGNNIIEALKIWNVTTNTQVKQYVGKGDLGLAWSPDGKYIAYGGFGETPSLRAVVIMDIATDKPVYVYQNHHSTVSVIAWSPNGKYIVSGEGNSQGNMVAHVWVA